jgi:hypothetical protein
LVVNVIASDDVNRHSSSDAVTHVSSILQADTAHSQTLSSILARRPEAVFMLRFASWRSLLGHQTKPLL